MRTRILMAVAAVAAALLLAVGALANGKTKPHPSSHGRPRVENRVLFAVLNGRNEISPSGRRGAGDPGSSCAAAAQFVVDAELLVRWLDRLGGEPGPAQALEERHADVLRRARAFEAALNHVVNLEALAAELPSDALAAAERAPVP